MTENINTSKDKDVEMKDDTKKEVPVKKEQEPIDPFYGKQLQHSILVQTITNFMFDRV